MSRFAGGETKRASVPPWPGGWWSLPRQTGSLSASGSAAAEEPTMWFTSSTSTPSIAAAG